MKNMKFVAPEVYLIANTKIDYNEVQKMLKTLGDETALQWLKRTKESSQSDGDYLSELAGRICYKSFGVGLNPNITQIRQKSNEYITNTLAKGDGSIFEHATCTFAFLNVSRVFTHELVRHRAGTAISQESLRYVRPENIGIWLPPDLLNKQKDIKLIIESIEDKYRKLEKSYNWEGEKFDVKKIITSSLRRILPQGIATNIIWSANHRTIRHVITMRTHESAEVEIRMIFDKVATIMRKNFPLIYSDFKYKKLADGTKSWYPEYKKV